MAAEGHAPSAGEYIVHHLTHLQNKKQASIVDFTVFNLDSIFYAVVLGVIGCFLFWRVAKTVTSGVPGRMQAAVELLVEITDVYDAGHASPCAIEAVDRKVAERSGIRDTG